MDFVCFVDNGITVVVKIVLVVGRCPNLVQVLVTAGNVVAILVVIVVAVGSIRDRFGPPHTAVGGANPKDAGVGRMRGNCLDGTHHRAVGGDVLARATEEGGRSFCGPRGVVVQKR